MAKHAPSAWKPMLLTDPQRFMKVISEDDHEKRFIAYEATEDILFGELIRYAIFCGRDPEMVHDIRAMYQRCVDRPVPLEIRVRVFDAVREAVDRARDWLFNAYLPYVWVETEGSIVAAATIELAGLAPLTGGDPMTAPKSLVEAVTAKEVGNRGAVFGGLLALGDPRVCELLWPHRDVLTGDEVAQAVQCITGFISAATIEFVLDWMEEHKADPRSRMFGSLASYLILQVQRMAMPFVQTGLRPFPVRSVTLDESRAMGQWIPFEDYRARIAPRFLALDRAETEPKVMPKVIEAWSIGKAKRH